MIIYIPNRTYCMSLLLTAPIAEVESITRRSNYRWKYTHSIASAMYHNISKLFLFIILHGLHVYLSVRLTNIVFSRVFINERERELYYLDALRILQLSSGEVGSRYYII